MKNILISLLSGAIGGSSITALYNFIAEKRKLKITYLREQLDKLYGPIFIILIHSQGAQEIQNKTLKPTHDIGKWF